MQLALRLGSRVALTAVLGGLLAAYPGTAFAADTDLVTLVNGQALMGEVKRLEQGRLEVSTDSMGTVYVEWDKVVEVRAVGEFEVETSDGGRYLGVMGPESAGKLRLTHAPDWVVLDLATVVRVVPIGESFFRRLDGSLNAGFGYTQSSGVAQLNADGDATFRRPKFEVSVSFTQNYTRQPDVPDSNRSSLNLSHIRFLPELWLLSSQGMVEGNRDQGFDLRTTAAFGVGRYMVKTNRALVSALGGVAVNREVPVEGDSVTNVDGLLGLNGSYFTYDYPKTTATFSLLVYPGFSDWGRVRVGFNGSLKRELIRDFFFVIGGYDSFDNKPPTEGADKNDIGVNLSIGWTFGR